MFEEYDQNLAKTWNNPFCFVPILKKSKTYISRRFMLVSYLLDLNN